MPLTAPLAERPLVHVERHLRLPVWPVLNGVLSWASASVGLGSLSRGLERRWGGRVTPMSLAPEVSDPFLMLVHHRHSFSPWDPVRPLSALVMPEGFPAHPHRGFETVTFVLEGALRHRDSAGVKMVYRGESAQWLTAGRGVLHEEMWVQERPGVNRHELYQIWVNLPRAHKLGASQIQLLGDGDVDAGSEPIPHSPLPVTELDGVRLTVLSGECRGLRSPVRTRSPMTLLRLSFATAGPVFTWDDLPPHHTALFFVRGGAVAVGDRRVGTGELARFERSPSAPARLRFTSLEPDTDLLVLTGEPLGEPVAMGGSMVMNTGAEVEQAHRDYQRGLFGYPWAPTASDAEWRAGLRR